MPEISQDLWDRAESILDAMGVELVDIEIIGSRKNRLLRVTIDHPDGVNLNLCGEASAILGSLFEEDEPIRGHYVLEVSSPGVERPLRSKRHWERSIGEQAKVKLAEGEGVVHGRIDSVDGESIVLVKEDGERVEVPFAKVVSGRTIFEWDGN